MLFDQLSSGNLSQYEPLIAVSAAMRQVIEQVQRVALEPVNVLVCGELGSGRETIARAIHAQSQSSGSGNSESAATGPFIKVDCAKNSHELEALLFATAGRVNQASADRRALERVRRGSHLYQSKGGTLFLRNIVDLPARMQSRLARILRDREVVVMDEMEQIELRPRVITAGDNAVDAAVQDGRMLPDLYKHLCGVRLDVPPLRERREDIPQLASHLLAVFCERSKVATKELSESALSTLAALPWRRGNGTELRSLLESLVVRGQEPVIGIQDVLAHVQLEAHAAWFPVGSSLRDARARFECEYIAAVLAQHRGRIPEAAKTLGIQRSNLYRKMRRLKVEPRPKHA